jgi:hypothetical protein
VDALLPEARTTPRAGYTIEDADALASGRRRRGPSEPELLHVRLVVPEQILRPEAFPTSGGHAPNVTRGVIHAAAALAQTPIPRPLHQPSGVQSPYPRRSTIPSREAWGSSAGRDKLVHSFEATLQGGMSMCGCRLAVSRTNVPRPSRSSSVKVRQWSTNDEDM